MTRTLLTLAAGLLAASASAAADPPSLYGLAHLRNESTAKATTYYRWGAGPWKKVVIEKGQSIAFSWAYDGASKHSPELRVRVDVDTDGVKWVEHTLSRGQSPDDNAAGRGHTFALRQLAGTDTRFITPVTNGAKVAVTDANSTKPAVK